MNFLRQILGKLHGCKGVVLFEDDVRRAQIEKLKKRTKLVIK